MITETQRQRRKSGLFSSDIARIMCGDSVTVALEKLGIIEEHDFEDNTEVKIGSLAEPLILDAYDKENGCRVERDIDTIIHPQFSFLGAHLDSRLPKVKNVEAKTAGVYNRHLFGNAGTDEVLDYILWQAQAAMSCADLASTDIPVCFLTLEATKFLILREPPPITTFKVPRDFTLEDALIKKTSMVWDCIQRGVTPPAEKHSDIKLIWSVASDRVVEADERILELYDKLVKARADEKEAEARKDELNFQIQSFMEDAPSILSSEGRTLATWKNDSDSDRFDEKLFAKEHPDLWKQYLRVRPGPRKFLVKTPNRNDRRQSIEQRNS